MLVIRLVDGGGGGNFADAKMPFFILYVLLLLGWLVGMAQGMLRKGIKTY